MENTVKIFKQLQNGKHMIFPNYRISHPVDYIIQHGFYWETYTSNLMKKILQPGMQAIEIGGHVGYHSLDIAEQVGDTGKVWVFEANPNLIDVIEENLKTNQLNKHVSVINKGVYSSDCTLEFNITHDKGTSSIYQNICSRNIECVSGKIEQKIQVDCICLDDYFQNQKVDFIKMDVEGAEGDAIKGARKLLRENNIHMIIEWWHSMPESLVQEIFFDILGGLGYEAFGIYPNDELKILNTYQDFTDIRRYEDLYVKRK